MSYVPISAGLEGGVKLLKGIADKHGDMTYADILQLASAIAVKVCRSHPNQQTHGAFSLGPSFEYQQLLRCVVKSNASKWQIF